MKIYLLAACVPALALAACADNSPGGKAAHERHQHFEAIGDAFKTIGDEVKRGSPDMTKVRPAADRIAALAPQIPTWFPPGSGPQDGKHTDALAAAWAKPDQLRAAAGKLADAANALKRVAETGNAAALGAAVKTAGAACKNCHDKFKKD